MQTTKPPVESRDEPADHVLSEADLTPLDVILLDGANDPNATVPDLQPRLRKFVETHLAKADATALEVTALCSAIRRYVAYLPAAELDAIAPWFDTQDPAVELELCKMVLRKLTAVPPTAATPYPQVARRLVEVSLANLHPRHLRRPDAGAAALNAVLALVVLGHDRLEEIRRAVQAGSDPGFCQQLARRARRLAQDYAARPDAESTAAIRARLEGWAVVVVPAPA